MADIPGIPRRHDTFGVAIYAPLDAAPVPPDILLIRGNSQQMMLLAEAAQAAGIAAEASLMGRPTCAILPYSIQTANTATSLGCIGNRVYTGLGNGEQYFALPGSLLDRLLQTLKTMVAANQALEAFHRARLAAAPVPRRLNGDCGSVGVAGTP
jgi:uncharacterized protein (DUF169 family)